MKVLMKISMKVFTKILKMATIIILLLVIVPHVCAAAGKKTSDEEAIRKAVEKYYEILSGNDLDQLMAYERITKGAALQMLAAKELGMQEYKNLEFHEIYQLTYQLEPEKTFWLVSIGYEMAVEGLPLLPGATSLLVVNEDGNFYVDNNLDELSEIVVNEIARKVDSKEWREWMDRIISEYDGIAESNAEVGKWVDQWREEHRKKTLEYQDWLQDDSMKFPMEEYRKKQGIGEEEKPEDSQTDYEYTVQNGDNLWKIALKYYGKGARWKAVYEQNKSVIGKNPERIYPGQVLHIPKYSSGGGQDGSSDQTQKERLEELASLLPDLKEYDFIDASRVGDINGDGMPEVCFVALCGWKFLVFYYKDGQVLSVDDLDVSGQSRALFQTEDGGLVLLEDSRSYKMTDTTGRRHYRIYEWTEEGGYRMTEDLWRIPSKEKDQNEERSFKYISSPESIYPFEKDYPDLLIEQSEFEQRIESLGEMKNLFEHDSKDIMLWKDYFRGPVQDREGIIEHVREEVRSWRGKQE